MLETGMANRAGNLSIRNKVGYRRSRTATNDADAKLGLGRILLDRGQVSDTQRLPEEGIRLKPTNVVMQANFTASHNHSPFFNSSRSRTCRIYAPDPYPTMGKATVGSPTSPGNNGQGGSSDLAL
jgi:hypothetical protein